MRHQMLKLIITVLLSIPCVAGAGAFDNSLWLSNNNGNGVTDLPPTLNVDRAGIELRRLSNTDANGIAIDPVANRLYISAPLGEITVRDLGNPDGVMATLNPPAGFAADMAFDGQFLYRTDTANRVVQKIDPATGTVVSAFDPAQLNDFGTALIGIAWDGTHLWGSEYNGFLGGERITQLNTDGILTGVSFAVPPGIGHVGGLAFDTTDGTLWLGAIDKVYHLTTTGTVLGSLAVAPTGRLIDGLEFQGIGRSFNPVAGSGAAIPGTNAVFTAFPQSPVLTAGNTAFLGTGAAQAGVFVSAPGDPYRPIANLSTLIPNGSGTFTGFTALAAAGNTTSFIGTGAGQAGVFVFGPGDPILPIRPIANLNTLIPNGSGTFTGFTALAAAGNSTSFIGTGAAQAGVFVFTPSDPTLPIRPTANLSTLIPNGSGTFTGFTALAAAGNSTSFIGTGAAQAGVFVFTPGDPLLPIRPIANLSTLIPNGSGTFTGFTALAAAGNTTSFIGTGAGQAGVFVFGPGDPILPIRPIANLNTPIPGGIGNFTGFSSLSSSALHTAFIGTGSNGQAGIYLASTLSKVVAVGDTLNGKRVTGLRFGRDGLDGVTIAFTAEFADGSQGVFTVRVDNYAYSGFFAPVSNPPAFNLVDAGHNVPIKFSLNGNQGLAVMATGYPKSQVIACPARIPFNLVPEIESCQVNKLTYNATTDRYTYIWATPKTWKNTCREFQLRLNDGTLHTANFRFK